MVILTVSGKEFPNPSEFSVTIQDWDSSNAERNANGDLMRDRITIKRKLSVKYSILTGEQMSLILKAMSDISFPVKYYDPQQDGFLTKTMYVGDRTPSFYVLRDNKVMYRDFSFSLIEI